MPFVQTIDNHRYILVAVLQHTLESVSVVKGADVYSLEGKYLGFWPVANMLGAIAERLRRYVEFMNRTVERQPRWVRSGDDLWLLRSDSRYGREKP